MKFYSRKTTRIPDFDYTSTNYYFVTICTYEKECIFGKPKELNWFGKIAQEDIKSLPEHFKGVSVDNFIIMPNHVHIILVINREETYNKHVSLNHIIGLYKSGVTRKIRERYPEKKIWQRSFHDHVIRNQNSYEKIWNYVEYNDRKWEEDCFYLPC